MEEYGAEEEDGVGGGGGSSQWKESSMGGVSIVAEGVNPTWDVRI